MITLSGPAIEKLKTSVLNSQKNAFRIFISGIG
jgi:Fe-S cluster assembly iron-binding protein IscA